MSDRTATPARTRQHAPGTGRGGLVGRLTVGDYLGRTAADAAQAVRCTGLKPGLDRSFDCDPELFGQVVAQQPEAGSDLPRNGMVTLYVAAPGAAIQTDTNPGGGSEPDPTPPCVAEKAIPITDPLKAGGGREVARHPGVRRRRKPGLATRAPTVAPGSGSIPAYPEPADEDQGQFVQVPPPREWISEADALVPADGEQEQTVLDDQGDEVSYEEFVVHADEVFAGRADTGLPAWRRTYPRRHRARASGGFLSARAWLTAHPWLVRAGGVMLVAWVLVAVTAALFGHSGAARQAGAVAGVLPHASLVGVHRSVRPRVPRVRMTRRVRRHSRARIRPRPREAPVSTAPTAPVLRPVARPVATAPVPAQVVVRGVAGSVAAAREVGPEQQRGGPFSP
jgi:hypothetical protein